MDVVHAGSNIALIWIVFLTLIAVLPWGVAFFFAVKGMARLRRVTKKVLPIAQDKARRVAGTVEQISQKVAAPMIGVHAAAARAHGIRTATFRRKQA